MTEFVLESITAQQKKVDSQLLAVLMSSLEHMFRTVVTSQQTSAEATEVGIDNHDFIATTTTLVKLKRW